MPQEVPCNSCGSVGFDRLFSKESPQGEIFQVVKCTKCSLVQVNPQPSEEEVAKYYSNEYFTKRTDRGYDNYYSAATKTEVSRVFQLNLEDLGFFAESFPDKPSALDIGCAAGYFVDYMKSCGWDASGIEIASDPAEYAKNTLGLNIIQEHFLAWDREATMKFDCITLWATIEHLHKPAETLEKIFRHLKPGGVLVMSTCRYGLLARVKGINWRYMNVPEHLYYFSLSGLIQLAEKYGFKTKKYITYGSGMTSKQNAGLAFRLAKRFFDWLVKKTAQGDMMAILLRKDPVT